MWYILTIMKKSIFSYTKMAKSQPNIRFFKLKKNGHHSQMLGNPHVTFHENWTEHTDKYEKNVYFQTRKRLKSG